MEQNIENISLAIQLIKNIKTVPGGAIQESIDDVLDTLYDIQKAFFKADQYGK